MGHAVVDQPEPTVRAFLDLADRYLGRVGTLVELGARDCVETEAFSKRLPHAQIFSFECNAHTLPLCRERAARLPNVTLVEKAASDTDGFVPFFPIDVARTRTSWADGNPGASSMFQASGRYPAETYVQREVEVPSVTLSSFMTSTGLPAIDLLWMDIQGAELMALRGLKDKLSQVKLLHLEVELFGIYEGAPLAGEIKSYLNQHGFLLVGFTHVNRFAADAVFVNRSLLSRWKAIRAAAVDAAAYPAVRVLASAVRAIAGVRESGMRLLGRRGEPQ